MESGIFEYRASCSVRKSIGFLGYSQDVLVQSVVLVGIVDDAYGVTSGFEFEYEGHFSPLGRFADALMGIRHFECVLGPVVDAYADVALAAPDAFYGEGQPVGLLCVRKSATGRCGEQ